jgi:hypothetical protein
VSLQLDRLVVGNRIAPLGALALLLCRKLSCPRQREGRTDHRFAFVFAA